MHRDSLRLIQQRVRQSQSSSENPPCRRVPAVINGRIACPSDGGGEPCHAVHLFRHKLGAELVEQTSRMCFPDSPMSLTDCVLLWSDGGCRHGFAPQDFELLAEPTLEFSSLVVNQPSRHATGVIQCSKKWTHTTFGCLPSYLQEQTDQWLPCHRALCPCEVLRANGVQDVADSRTHRIATGVLRELQLRCHQ